MRKDSGSRIVQGPQPAPGASAGPISNPDGRRPWITGLAIAGLILLVALPRLTALNQYLIVDEPDRWRWAENFVWALSRGDLAGTLVGDGYPGIAPVWAETIWVFGEAARRSLAEGQWIGEPGLYLLFHEWDRVEFLSQQRLPIVLLNTALALAVIWSVWRLFGRRVALVSGLLIALDPFYLSDSRVNRAEAVITGLMTLSMLCLVFYARRRRLRTVALSGILGGLSFLTKIQALAMLPAVGLVALFIHLDRFPLAPAKAFRRPAIKRAAIVLTVWVAAAVLTWIVLWPAMWVTPLETLTLVYDYTTRKVGAEGVNLFFMGQTYEDADPGLLFYPVIFLLRLTPLALIGLLGALLHFISHIPRLTFHVLPTGTQNRSSSPPLPFSAQGSFILVTYILVYGLVMSLGSHKQDRYLLPIFLSVDILAAMGLVYLGSWLSGRLRLDHFPFGRREIAALAVAGLLLVQLATVLPHHPYYYSYFNPLLGGGRTAVQTVRIGWGEGMDRVGAYLAAKPDSRELVVSSRFTHNMLTFNGRLISLLPDGRWTQADYIVLYIQQVQRRQEPSPGFIDYFLARPPEKVVTIGGIEYAWIYPIPFTNRADPQVSFIPGQAALLGYSWERSRPVDEPVNRQKGGAVNGQVSDSTPQNEGQVDGWQIRLLWENLGLDEGVQLAVRLVNSAAETAWTPCRPASGFMDQAVTAGAYVESLCRPELAALPPGLYTVAFGLAAGDERPQEVMPFLFPQGRLAVRLSAGGEVDDVPELERLAAVAGRAIPAAAEGLNVIYDGRLKLAAYRLRPLQPRPGDTVGLTLYWQRIGEFTSPLRLTVQLADSRSLSLGRADALLPVDDWLPGKVMTTTHRFELPADPKGPLAGRLEVTLANQARVPLVMTDSAGEALEGAVARFTVAPEHWPNLEDLEREATGFRPVQATWQNGITLEGYAVRPAQPGETLPVTLYWSTAQPVAEDYVVFVHLVDQAGQIETQNDDRPRTGAYPTAWWRPGPMIEDVHPLNLPQDMSPGTYRLLVGLYHPADGARLPLSDNRDSINIGVVDVQP